MKRLIFVLSFFVFLLVGCGSDCMSAKEELNGTHISDERVEQRVQIDMHGKENKMHFEKIDKNATKGLGAFLKEN